LHNVGKCSCAGQNKPGMTGVLEPTNTIEQAIPEAASKMTVD